MLAAIEIYNKPDFLYREETFAILAINGWELLLKSRILQLDRNRISAIIEYEKRHNADGKLSTKLYRKKNRSGNHVSVGLFKAADLLAGKYGEMLDPLVRTNLEMLTEIRDNSIHFFNKDIDLCKRILEIGTASLRNYVALSRKWFGVDLLEYNFFIMPIGFFRDFHSAEAIPLNGEERRLIDFLKTQQKNTKEDSASDYSLSLEVDIKLKRTSGTSLTEVRITNDPSATSVKLEEEDVLERYPWEYKNLSIYLSKRYSDFSQNKTYHSIRKPLEKDARYCIERYLDPSNSKSPRKRFYNPNIIKEFDKHYIKNKS
jgi:hypothetical protein